MNAESLLLRSSCETQQVALDLWRQAVQQRIFDQRLQQQRRDPVPGRFLLMTTFVTAAAIVLLSLRQTTESVQEFP